MIALITFIVLVGGMFAVLVKAGEDGDGPLGVSGGNKR
jgi:uncharacterized ion transporter superfamily protein YfcC